MIVRDRPDGRAELAIGDVVYAIGKRSVLENALNILDRKTRSKRSEPFADFTKGMPLTDSANETDLSDRLRDYGYLRGS